MKTSNSPSDFLHGQRVRYVPGHANGDENHPDCEDGTVNSANDHNVFVKFDRQASTLGWSGTTSQSCDPKDLRMVEGFIIDPVRFFGELQIERMVMRALMRKGT